MGKKWHLATSLVFLWAAESMRPRLDEPYDAEGLIEGRSAVSHTLPTSTTASSSPSGSNGSQQLRQANSTRTFCDLVHYAIPGLTNVSMVPDAVGEACDILGLEAAQCRTRHSLWSCIAEETACKCKWRPFCHGIGFVGKANAEPLVCRPNLGYGTCQCWAFRHCPAQSGSWQCFQAARASYNSQDRWQLHEAEFVRFSLGTGASQDFAGKHTPASKLEESMLKAGSCHCKQDTVQIPIPLSPAEEEALMKSGLGSISLPYQNATAAGIAIENQVSKRDDSGKTRLALTINTKKDTKRPSDAASGKQPTRTSSESFGLSMMVGSAPAQGAAVGGDLPEHCVITDGVVTFNSLHVAVLLLMMLPVALVLLLIVCCNFGMLLGLWLGRNDMPFPHYPGTRRSSFGAPRTMPPASLTLLLVSLMVLMKINVTSVLTTAHVIIDDLASKGAFPAAAKLTIGSLQIPSEGLASGVLLASEPLGGIFGVLLVGAYLLRKPKETVLVSCALVFLCSIGFLMALRLSSLTLMIFLRFLSGLGEGSLYLGHVYLARLSAPDVRTKIFGYWELGTAAGLVSGPALASLLASGPWTQILAAPGEAMALCIALLAFLLTVAIITFFPRTSELCEDGAVGARPLSGSALTDQAWTVQLTLSGSTIARLLLRLAWEAAAAIVLATHFCLGHKISGYGITLTFVLYMAGQSIFVMYCEKFSDHTLIRACEFLELIGLVLMFRVPSDVETTLMEDVIGASAFLRLAQFLFGSALFYTGNCLTSAPLSSWATKFGPGSESVMFFAHLAIQSGVFAGGLLSRVFTSMDPHQNMIVAMLLPVVCLQILLSELGIGITSISDMRCHVED